MSEKINSNLFLSYLIAFLSGLCAFLAILAFQDWNVHVFFELDVIMPLILISGITVKFLTGVGLTITFAMFSSFIFRSFSEQMKGNKKKLLHIQILLTLVAVSICIYAGYVLLSSVVYTRALTTIEKLLGLVFGFWSLIIFVYLFPVIRNEYDPYYTESSLTKLKNKFGSIRYSLWRGYKSKIRKDYGKVNAKEYDRYKLKIEAIRDKMSGILLFPFTFILIPLFPLLCLCLVLWLRIFSLDQKPFTTAERILLIIILFIVVTFSSILFLFVNVTTLIPYFNSSYSLGVFSGMLMLVYVINKS